MLSCFSRPSQQAAKLKSGFGSESYVQTMSEGLKTGRCQNGPRPTTHHPEPTKPSLLLSINNPPFYRTQDIATPPNCAILSWWMLPSLALFITADRNRNFIPEKKGYSHIWASRFLPGSFIRLTCSVSPKRGYLGSSHEISLISSPSWTEYRVHLDLPEWMVIPCGYGLAVTVATVSENISGLSQLLKWNGWHNTEGWLFSKL